MARYIFKSEENEYGYYNKVRFEAEGWPEIVDQFVVFLRGEGFVISHDKIIEGINNAYNEYVEIESGPLLEKCSKKKKK